MPTGNTIIKEQYEKLIQKLREHADRISLSTENKAKVSAVLGQMETAYQEGNYDFTDIFEQIETERKAAFDRYTAANQPKIDEEKIDFVNSEYEEKIRDDAQIYDFFSYVKNEFQDLGLVDEDLAKRYDVAKKNMDDAAMDYEEKLDDFENKFEAAEKNISEDALRLSHVKELTKDNLDKVNNTIVSKIVEVNNLEKYYNDLAEKQGKDYIYYDDLAKIQKEEKNALAMFDIETREKKQQLNIKDDNKVMTSSDMQDVAAISADDYVKKSLEFEAIWSKNYDIIRENGYETHELMTHRNDKDREKVAEKHKKRLDEVRAKADKLEYDSKGFKKLVSDLKDRSDAMGKKIEQQESVLAGKIAERDEITKAINERKEAIFAGKKNIQLSEKETRLKNEYDDAKKTFNSEFSKFKKVVTTKSGFLGLTGVAPAEKLAKSAQTIHEELSKINLSDVDEREKANIKSTLKETKNLADDKGLLKDPALFSDMHYINSVIGYGYLKKIAEKNPGLKDAFDQYTAAYRLCEQKDKDGNYFNSIEKAYGIYDKLRTKSNSVDYYYKGEQENRTEGISKEIDDAQKNIKSLRSEKEAIDKDITINEKKSLEVDKQKEHADKDWAVCKAMVDYDEITIAMNKSMTVIRDQINSKEEKSFDDNRKEERDKLQKTFQDKKDELLRQREAHVRQVKNVLDENIAIRNNLVKDYQFTNSAKTALYEMEKAAEVKKDSISKYNVVAEKLKNNLDTYKGQMESSIAAEEEHYINAIHDKRTFFSSSEYKSMDDALTAYSEAKRNKAANLDELYNNAKTSVEAYVKLRDTKDGMKKTINGQKRLDSAKNLLAMFETKEELKKTVESNKDMINSEIKNAGKVKVNVSKDLTTNDKKTKISDSKVIQKENVLKV